MVEVTPPGGATIDMAYTDATQDRRIIAGDTRMSYNQLGLSSQGATSGTSKATWFARDPEGTLVGMLNANSSEPDLYYLFDGLGSVAATTDPSGNVVRRYAYEPYGEEIGRSTTDANPWRYASGYYDEATGMLKFGTRYYMPDLLRWTQRDRVMGRPNDPMTLNPYGYVACNPASFVDPTGRSHCAAGSTVAGAWGVFTGGALALGGATAGVSILVGGMFLAASTAIQYGCEEEPSEEYVPPTIPPGASGFTA